MSLVGHQCKLGICGDTKWGESFAIVVCQDVNIKEWMSWSHRNEKGNSNCSVMRMQSNAMRMTYRNDIISGGSV